MEWLKEKEPGTGNEKVEREITYERLGGARQRSNPPPFRHCPTYGFTRTFSPRVRFSRGILRPGSCRLRSANPREIVSYDRADASAFSNARTDADSAYSRHNVVAKTLTANGRNARRKLRATRGSEFGVSLNGQLSSGQNQDLSETYPKARGGGPQRVR
jgi:hypothetical protein